jgi:hypothetical protein
MSCESVHEPGMCTSQGRLLAHQQATRPYRSRRRLQCRLDIEDDQESEKQAQNTQERDEFTSSRKEDPLHAGSLMR